MGTVERVRCEGQEVPREFEVLPDLGRSVRGRAGRSGRRTNGVRRTRLADLGHWSNVMLPRSGHTHSRRWLPNDGGHRALGDVEQTRQHLLRMTAP